MWGAEFLVYACRTCQYSRPEPIMVEPSTPATQEDDASRKSDARPESACTDPAPAAATRETDALVFWHYCDGRYEPVQVVVAQHAYTLERQRDEALKIVALARKCVDLDGTTVRGMKDSDPCKGPMNSLADALEDEQLHELMRQRELPWIQRWQQETGKGDSLPICMLSRSPFSKAHIDRQAWSCLT